MCMGMRKRVGVGVGVSNNNNNNNNNNNSNSNNNNSNIHTPSNHDTNRNPTANSIDTLVFFNKLVYTIQCTLVDSFSMRKIAYSNAAAMNLQVGVYECI